MHLDGFGGPLDLLLDLAERERIDLSRISVHAMAEQFAAAMARFEKHVSLERRATWLVLAARLVQLRSLLLVPATPEAAATWRDAERELARLRELRFIRAGAAWLEERPQQGEDVVTRRQREGDPRVASYMQLWKPASRCSRQKLTRLSPHRSINRRFATFSAFRTPWPGCAPRSRR